MVADVIAETAHQRVEDGRGAAREEVDSGAVSGEANRLLRVCERALTRRPAQEAAETSPYGPVVVGRPRVVDAGVRDRERPRHHRRPQLGVAGSLQEGLVPLEDDAVP